MLRKYNILSVFTNNHGFSHNLIKKGKDISKKSEISNVSL